MNIVVIHGSMRKGNTFSVAQEAIAQLKTYPNVNIQEFYVRELNLPFCVSCHQCFVKGEQVCPHHAQLTALVRAIESSDGILVSGVVYAMHLNAAMKNLIDHLAYYFHRPRLFGKKGMVISTTAGAGEKIVANYLKSILAIWGVNPIETVSFKMQNTDCLLNHKQKQQLTTATKNFYRCIVTNKTGSPSFSAVSMYNAFRGMSSCSLLISLYDKEYWEKTGLSSKVYPQKIGFLKTLYGMMVYHVLKKVMVKNHKGNIKN